MFNYKRIPISEAGTTSDRKGIIGGSQVGAVLGLDGYVTQYDVYLDFNGHERPVSPMTPELGMFTKMVPRPMGTSNVGSYSFLMPRYMRTQPMTIMTRRPGSAASATMPAVSTSAAVVRISNGLSSVGLTVGRTWLSTPVSGE